MAHSDERCVYHMTEYPINYPPVTHIRLPWTFKVVSDMMFVPFNLSTVPELPWTFKVVPDVVNLWPPVSKILKPCYHGDILESTKDVPELQWYNLIGQVSEYVCYWVLTYDGSHVSQGRLQVSQHLQCDDQVHVWVMDNNAFMCAISFSSERHHKV